MKRHFRKFGAPTAGLAWRGLITLGMGWTLPNTLPGLLAGLIGLAFGARLRWQRRELAVVVRRWPWVRAAR